jgi:hypothetical protein
MVMTVFLLQPVSVLNAAVSSVMVRGDRLHRQFISFHSLSERLIFINKPPWYTAVYPYYNGEVDRCQPQNGNKKTKSVTALENVNAARLVARRLPVI